MLWLCEELYVLCSFFPLSQSECIGALVAFAPWVLQLSQCEGHSSDFDGLVAYMVSLIGPLLLTTGVDQGTHVSCLMCYLDARRYFG